MSKLVEIIGVLNKLKAEHGPAIIGIAMTEKAYRALKADCLKMPSFPGGWATNLFYGLPVFIKAKGPIETLYAPPSDDHEEGR